MIKPFEVDIEEEVASKKVNDKIIVAPFEEEVSDDIKIDTRTSQQTNSDNLIEEIKKPESILQSSIKLLSSLSGIFITFILFIFIAILAHSLQTIVNVLQTPSLSDYIYLFGLSLLITALVMNIFSNIKQMQRIKEAKQIKQKLSLQKQQPTQEIIAISHELIKHYKVINTMEQKEGQKENLEAFKLKLTNTHNYSAIYNNIDSLLLSPIDKKANELIHNASLQAAFSTAISPVPIIDMLIIIWRSFMLTKEIALLYGYRPGGLTTLLLLKQGLINMLFAGVSELTLELTNEITSATMLRKISQSAGQGVANGILLTRLGYSVVDTCRPLKLTEKRVNVVKSIMDSLMSSFKRKEKVNC